MRWIGFLLVVILGVAISAEAQYRAGIQGVIADPQGAVISGATVTLTNKETNVTRQVKSDVNGVYNFLSLAPSHYTITVESTGFRKKTLEDVTVSAEQTQAVNIQLDLGAVNQTITVQAETDSTIDTETGKISSTLTSDEVQNLQSLGRDPFQLLRLASGVFGDGSHNNGGGSQNLIRSNFYNIFNQLNFAPLQNPQSIGTIQLNAATGVQTNPGPTNALQSTVFGQAQNGLAGRVIELEARFSF